MISIILCLLSFASGKLVKSTVKMTPEVPVAYLTRFATDPGKSTFMFKSRISRGSDSTYEDRKVIYLNIYTEKEWDGG